MVDPAPLTPMMQQWQAARDAHPGMMVFFQNGEFYELFGDDAVHGSKILGITLTKREETPMAGFPLAKLEHYLRMLLAAGERVAVAEQMEPAGGAKKIIRRDVTRVVTLGTVTDDELLDPKSTNCLAAAVVRGSVAGLAWVDLTSGAFHAADVDRDRLRDECARLSIAEVLVPESQAEALRPHLPEARSVTVRPDWTFDAVTALGALKKKYGVLTLGGFGFADDDIGLRAAGAAVIYLSETLKTDLHHLRRLTPYRPGDSLGLDVVTRRSLELTRTLRDNDRDGSLVSVLDRTVTAMGSRLLTEWLLSPLTDAAKIDARLSAVDELKANHPLRDDLRELLQLTADLPRLTTRAATGRASPRDLSAVARTLRQLPAVKAKLSARRSVLLNNLEAGLELFIDLRNTLDATLIDEPPVGAKDGGIVREGFHAELDELRRLGRDGKSWIARYQADEITRTGIHSLKVGYTGVIGYYIEITNSNEGRVPPNYLHERTLKNAKRYVTPELKEYEEKVLTAEDKSKALEFELFVALRETVAGEAGRLLTAADVLSTVDVLASLADLAAARNYVRPTIVSEPILHIVDGRHPVLDVRLPAGTLVPNDVMLDADGGFWLITGPNMSGKSTFIRQVALLTLLAHVGSFVPAASATIGLTDRIFTRVGASDELGRGQSTFMVEMTEAANILHNATPSSLVILDEIGRGTSTYDGVSLAWAITEHLHDVTQCRTLFATHYHELSQLEGPLPRLRNRTVTVVEEQGSVHFLHKIAVGSADKSYGIHVARLAGLPESLLARAEAVLASLESPHEKPVRTPRLRKSKPDVRSLFDTP